MKLEYIEDAKGNFYYPREKGFEYKGVNSVECYAHKIKKCFFGIWIISFYQSDYYFINYEEKPNTKIILYPNDIKRVQYKLSND